jgi:hypothetical protein
MANAFKNYIAASVTTQTSVYTTPSATQTTVIGLNVANTDTSAASVDIQVTSGATTVYILKGAPVPVGGALVAVGGDQKLVLEAADVLKVTSTVTVDVAVSVLEIS